MHRDCALFFWPMRCHLRVKLKEWDRCAHAFHTETGAGAVAGCLRVPGTVPVADL